MHDDRRREEGMYQLRHGMALERAHHIAEAVDQYRRAIQNDPRLYQAHQALARYYQRGGQIAKAADELYAVANIAGDFLTYFNLGYVLFEIERYDQALEAFQHCLAIQPDDTATHYEIGFIFLRQGDFEHALDHLQRSLQRYPEDWEIHHLLGRCYLGLRRYDEALLAFGQALLLTDNASAQAELLEHAASVERHREFRFFKTFKDQIYAEEGVVYLGSARDDGLNLEPVPHYHFSYVDIATTLQRLGALSKSSNWHLSALMAADTLAQPLAYVLGRLLNLPVRRPDQLHNDDRVLLVFAVSQDSELLQLAEERLPCPVVAFSLGLIRSRHSRVLPDLIGIVAHASCTLPWEAELRQLRADAAPSALVDGCVQTAAAAISQAIEQTPIDINLPRQVRYYTRTHRRLLFARQ
jgi:tetratricopeptide (TPR) repeat protein